MHNKVNNTTKKLVLNRLKSLIRHFVGKEQVMVFFLIIMCQFHGFRKFLYTDEFLWKQKSIPTMNCVAHSVMELNDFNTKFRNLPPHYVPIYNIIYFFCFYF